MIVLTILSAQSPQENTDGRPDINTFLKCHLGKGSKTMAPTLTLSDLEERPCIESNDQPNDCVGKLNLTYLWVIHWHYHSGHEHLEHLTYWLSSSSTDLKGTQICHKTHKVFLEVLEEIKPFQLVGWAAELKFESKFEHWISSGICIWRQQLYLPKQQTKQVYWPKQHRSNSISVCFQGPNFQIECAWYILKSAINVTLIFWNFLWCFWCCSRKQHRDSDCKSMAKLLGAVHLVHCPKTGALHQ